MTPQRRWLAVGGAVLATLIAAVPATADDVSVVGVVLADGRPARAALTDARTGKQVLTGEGQQLGDVSVIHIRRDRVVISRGGERTELRMFTGGGAERALARSASEPVAGHVPAAVEPTAPPVAVAATAMRRRVVDGRFDEVGTPTDAVDRDKAGVGAPTGDAAGSGTGGTGGAAAARLVVRALLQDGRTVSGVAFVAADVRDLIVDVAYGAGSGRHTQRLELISPEGAVYQRLTREVDLTASSRVETSIPVGGTWITRHGMRGGWSIAVYLDAASAPSASASFRLE